MKARFSPRAFAQVALVIVAGAIIVFSGWLTDHVTTRAIAQPTGAYTVPYETHGGTVFISSTERIEIYLGWGLAGFLLLGQWSLNLLGRRSAR